MGAMRRPRLVLCQALGWLLAPALLTAGLLCEAALPGPVGRQVTFDAVPVLLALAACWLAGMVVTGRAPEQPAGWAFLGLASAVAWSVVTEAYADAGLTGGRDLPGTELAAAFSDSSFVWWFVFLALVLQLTPPATAGRRLPRLTVATVAAGLAYQVLALVRSTPLDPPFDELVSPLAVESLDTVARVVASVLIYGLGLCLVLSVVLLVRAWHRAEGAARDQMLWLVAGAVPVAPCIVGAFVASRADRNEVASLLIGLALVTLVLGAGLSVLRYRLYDVERVVTDSAAYAIASVAVVMVYLGVVVVISRSTPLDAGAQLATIAATLAGVATARVAYVWARRAVGRRVNRARFDAVAAVQAGLAAPAADLDELIAGALGSNARVVYPAADGSWVLADGRAVLPADDAVDVRRHDALVARVEFDPAESDRDIAAAVAGAASAEVDNVALRAELARQLELVRESRARLATAHSEERRRIERDLHDGAQQRLLAIAMRLRSARLNGGETVLESETERAIEDLQVTVHELRDLAAGLQPAALAAGGLLAAVSDLAARAPVAVRYDVVDERFSLPVEGAAWFVIAEGVTNAVKHSGAPEVRVAVCRGDGQLVVAVEDAGGGGADATSRGLQGLADRVGAVGGSMLVAPVDPHGTRLEARFPCVS
jgi:signal transduction histidine kinase